MWCKDTTILANGETCGAFFTAVSAGAGWSRLEQAGAGEGVGEGVGWGARAAVSMWHGPLPNLLQTFYY